MIIRKEGKWQVVQGKPGRGEKALKPEGHLYQTFNTYQEAKDYDNAIIMKAARTRGIIQSGQ